MFLLVDYGNVLCSTTNKLQQNSDAFSIFRNIDRFVVDSPRLLPRLHLTFVAFCLLSVIRKH